MYSSRTSVVLHVRPQGRRMGDGKGRVRFYHVRTACQTTGKEKGGWKRSVVTFLSRPSYRMSDGLHTHLPHSSQPRLPSQYHLLSSITAVVSVTLQQYLSHLYCIGGAEFAGPENDGTKDQGLENAGPGK